MLSKQSQNYLNEVKNRINKRRGKINIISTHPIPKTYKIVFLNGSPSFVINAKELQGENIEGSIVQLNGSSYKVIKRLIISRTVIELHLDNVSPQ